MAEYVEFFKGKKQIKQEWLRYTESIDVKVKEFQESLKIYDMNIASLNEVLPVMVEIMSLVARFEEVDTSARNELSRTLRLGNLPNNGYLLKEQMVVDNN